MAPASTIRLGFQNVTRHYTEAGAGISDVSFEVKSGEIICLVGPSGAGKSTILRLAAGLERPDSGSISIDGNPVAGPGGSIAPEKRGVGLIFQDFALFPHLTVLENVAFGLGTLAKHERADHARHVLCRVNMDHLADAYPNTLSGGEQQRVALARALATRPGVMLMDEPFSDLDTQLRDTVREELSLILRNSGAATILVTHDPVEAMRIADRIVFLRDGRIIQIGTPQDLYDDPVDAGAAGFFGDVNVIHANVAQAQAATPIGAAVATGLDEGLTVEVLVRPRDIQLAPSQGHGQDVAVVSARRMVGGSCLIELDAGGEGMPQRITAEVAGEVAPDVGTEVRLAFDPARAHVFPCARLK